MDDGETSTDDYYFGDYSRNDYETATDDYYWGDYSRNDYERALGPSTDYPDYYY